MKLKTYMCHSMDDALKKIRAELGPDAVIISSLNEGSKIRVTAACDKIPEPKEKAPSTLPNCTALETKNTICHIMTYHGVPASVAERIIEQTCTLSPSLLEMGAGAVFKNLLTFTPLNFSAPEKQPHQIMLAGPVGVGKTVTLSKIATEYRLKDKPVEIISADYLKAGAQEQIQAYAKAINRLLCKLSG